MLFFKIILLLFILPIFFVNAADIDWFEVNKVTETTPPLSPNGRSPRNLNNYSSPSPRKSPTRTLSIVNNYEFSSHRNSPNITPLFIFESLSLNEKNDITMHSNGCIENDHPILKVSFTKKGISPIIDRNIGKENLEVKKMIFLSAKNTNLSPGEYYSKELQSEMIKRNIYLKNNSKLNSFSFEKDEIIDLPKKDSWLK
jgi:hypothetical protein